MAENTAHGYAVSRKFHTSKGNTSTQIEFAACHGPTPVLSGYDRCVAVAAVRNAERRGFVEDWAPVSGTFSSRGPFPSA